MNIKFKQLLIVLSIIFASEQINAQEFSNETEIEIYDNISRANFSAQGIYYSFEKKLAPIISLYSDVGMSAVFGSSSTYGYRWAFSPVIATEGRWYFNYKRRNENGKKTLFNAADFLSLQSGYIFKPVEKQSFADINSGFFLFTNVGMQRTWGRHINFEIKLGFGATYSDEFNSGGLAYNFNFKFGYIFNNSNK